MIGVNSKFGTCLRLIKFAQIGKYTKEDLAEIKSLAEDYYGGHVGTLNGFCVSEYAFAVLHWLGTDETLSIFNELYKPLTKERKRFITSLIRYKPDDFYVDDVTM